MVVGVFEPNGINVPKSFLSIDLGQYRMFINGCFELLGRMGLTCFD